MAPDDPITIGELGRRLEKIDENFTELREEMRTRHHTIANKMNEFLVPFAQHGVRLETTEKRVDALEGEVKGVTKKVAAWSGGAAVVAFLGSLIPWPWKH